MGHKEIVSQLESILPEIRATSDPEGVMLKYATAKNFAPAELEKLAQVYNIAKTLTFMDKSASRGGTFRVVETEALLARYTQPNPRRKSAQAFADAPEVVVKWASQDDLRAWIDEPLEKVAFAGFPDMAVLADLESRRAQESTASVQLAELHKQASAALHARGAAQVDATTVDQVAFDAGEDLRELFAKAADTIFTNAIAFQEVEEDALALHGDSVKAAADAFASYLAAVRIPATRFDPAAPRKRRLARDRHGLAGVVKQASDLLEFQQAAVLFKSAETTTASRSAPPPLNETNLVDRDPSGGRVSPRDIADQPDVTASPSGSRPKGDGAMLSAFDNLLGPGQGPAIAGNFNRFQSVVDLLKPAKNKNQIQVDRAQHDTHHAAALHRLLVTDPIISEADPDKVVQLANTISAASPRASRDINFLRFALREALQYDGVPTHTYKDLATTQELQAKTHKHNLENEDLQYGSGRR